MGSGLRVLSPVRERIVNQDTMHIAALAFGLVVVLVLGILTALGVTP